VYKDTSHLYWGIYPFKITLRTPDEIVKMQRDVEIALTTYTSAFSRAVYWDERRKVGAKIREWRRQKLAYYVASLTEGARYSCSGHGGTISFFFDGIEHANSFIAKHHLDIKVAYSPISVEALALMNKDHSVEVRRSFYWGEYEWKINFRYLNTRDCELVDSRMEELFPPGPDDELNPNALYSGCSTPTLYLHTYSDVILVKMAVGEYIANIKHAVLTKDV
jgi:hypothetical protein